MHRASHVSRRLALAAVLAPAMFSSAQAQGYPAKPIRVVNPWGAGGASDSFVRPIMQELSQVLKQPVVVENMAGANGMIGAAAVARASPDGHTLLVANLGPTAISPALEPRIAYDSVKDFAPVTQMVSAAQVLVLRDNLAVRSVADLVAYGRAHPQKLSYGSVGMGSTTHLAFEIFSQMTGAEFLHVPYKGSAQVVTDLLGGQIDMAFINVASAASLAQKPGVRLLGVSTLRRSGALPQLPTIAETVPGFELNSWWGLMAPAGTPQAVVDRLQREVAQILREASMTQRLRDMGLEVEGSTPTQFGALIQNDLQRWAAIVKARNIKLQ